MPWAQLVWNEQNWLPKLLKIIFENYFSTTCYIEEGSYRYANFGEIMLQIGLNNGILHYLLIILELFSKKCICFNYSSGEMRWWTIAVVRWGDEACGYVSVLYSSMMCWYLLVMDYCVKLLSSQFVISQIHSIYSTQLLLSWSWLYIAW